MDYKEIMAKIEDISRAVNKIDKELGQLQAEVKAQSSLGIALNQNISDSVNNNVNVCRERFSNHAERIMKLEDAHTWGVRWLMGLCATVIIQIIVMIISIL